MAGGSGPAPLLWNWPWSAGRGPGPWPGRPTALSGHHIRTKVSSRSSPELNQYLGSAPKYAVFFLPETKAYFGTDWVARQGARALGPGSGHGPDPGHWPRPGPRARPVLPATRFRAKTRAYFGTGEVARGSGRAPLFWNWPWSAQGQGQGQAFSGKSQARLGAWTSAVACIDWLLVWLVFFSVFQWPRMDHTPFH